MLILGSSISESMNRTEKYVNKINHLVDLFVFIIIVWLIVMINVKLCLHVSRLHNAYVVSEHIFQAMIITRIITNITYLSKKKKSFLMLVSTSVYICSSHINIQINFTNSHILICRLTLQTLYFFLVLRIQRR